MDEERFDYMALSIVAVVIGILIGVFMDVFIFGGLIIVDHYYSSDHTNSFLVLLLAPPFICGVAAYFIRKGWHQVIWESLKVIIKNEIMITLMFGGFIGAAVGAASILGAELWLDKTFSNTRQSLIVINCAIAGAIILITDHYGWLQIALKKLWWIPVNLFKLAWWLIIKLLESTWWWIVNLFKLAWWLIKLPFVIIIYPFKLYRTRQPGPDTATDTAVSSTHGIHWDPSWEGLDDDQPKTDTLDFDDKATIKRRLARWLVPISVLALIGYPLYLVYLKACAITGPAFVNEGVLLGSVTVISILIGGIVFAGLCWIAFMTISRVENLYYRN
ncbi:hypothetical protein ACFL2U_00880 [Patescibacteria group bacterium]